jgi:2-hydroxycyclohexanecarboxyl-CoA dehydrogenase
MAKGDVALVTGASGGMGQAVVQRLIKDGFRVAGIDINDKALKELGKKVGAKAKLYKVDQTNEAECRKVVKKIEKDLGPISVLVNTIGWCGTTRFHEEDSAYWRKVIAINYDAVLYITHPVLLGMIKQNRGKIVNVSSDAGRIGTSGEAVYAGTKAGVIAFSKSLARENARYNVNVNCIAPGPTATPLLQAEIEENPDLIKRMTRLIPFRRVGQPEDMANAISFFCSSDSDYITGQVLSVSGGLTMV